jgi:hypothetical protein
MATYRALLAVLPIALTGCGSAGAGAGTTGRQPPRQALGAKAQTPSPSGLAASTPAGWFRQRSPLGATLAAPASWRPERADRNALTAVDRGRAGALIGYLNLTPRQGGERAAGWERFRLGHLQADGEREVRAIAYAPSVRLAAGRGACLTDTYTTSTNARYEELACIVEGARTAVVLGAAPPTRWATEAPIIAQAIAAATP